MTNKKMFFAPLLIAAGCLLAACSSDKIIARPSWIDNKIIDNVDTKDNEMKLIYDAVKTLGDTNSNVLNNLLYGIATKKIGTVEELSKFAKSETVTDEFKTFVNDHPYYQTTNTLKVTKGKEDAEEMSEDEKYAVSLKMVQDQYNQLQNDIAQKLYDQIKGGSYSEDSLFYESKFIQSLRKDMQDIPSVQEIYDKRGIILNDRVEFTPRKIDPNTGELSPWSTHILKFLNVNETYDETKGKLYDKYIEEKILKDIYRNYLIQAFVRDQRYPNLGRTYARKVKMITVQAGSGSIQRQTRNMMSYFASEYIMKDGTTQNYNFENIENAMRGIVGIDTIPYKLLKDGGDFKQIKVGKTTKELDLDTPLKWTFHNMNGTEGEETYVFEGTKLGDLVKKYQNVYDITYKEENGTIKFTHTLRKNQDSEFTSAYNDLTGSGAYSIEHGLALKELEIRTSSYTKEGWFIKNGGLSDLGTEIRDRLFNISVSNIIDNPQKYEDYDSTDYAKYFKINGVNRAFLTSKSADEQNLVVLEDGSNYHIIEIQEAVSTSKLSTENNKNSYRYLKATEDGLASAKAMNEIVYNVVKEVATGDTYKSNAEQYYLMMSNIIFYDEDVYAYFKSQYPELFK